MSRHRALGPAALLASAGLALLLAACSGGDGGGGVSAHDRLLAVRGSGLVELALPALDEHVLIANTSEAIPLEPALSPDGKRIAYTRQLVGAVIPGESTDLGADVYVAGVDGSDPQVAVQHVARGDLIRSPAWITSGELLVSAQRFAGGTFTAEAVRVNLTTNEQTTVLDNAIALDVSPDGSKIAYVEVDPSFNQSLWIANIDGSDRRQLAGIEDDFATIGSPRFSPDGRTIAFAAAAPLTFGISLRGPLQNGLPADIWAIGLDGTGLRPLVELKLDSPSLAWSGDGARLYVYAGDGLYEVDPATLTHERLGDGTFHGQIDWLGSE